MKEATLYQKVDGGDVQCFLCAHRCRIRPGGLGVCQVRENQDGTLVTHAYGRVIAHHIDPIEKKPLYHVAPGSRVYSMATPGCNFRCGWCQNADIAQVSGAGVFSVGEPATPAEIVAQVQRAGCPGIAYTYTEPTIFFEYAYETAQAAQETGLWNVFVTNGYMTAEALDMIAPYLTAANVDLKTFRAETYRKEVGARLEPVLETMERLKERGIWLEVTTLIIPGLNDSAEELRELARFMVERLGRETPWHLSRFFPSGSLSGREPTPVATLEETRAIGHEEGLEFIYLGNLGRAGSANTQCPGCGNAVIKRGLGGVVNTVTQDGCSACGRAIPGVHMSAAT